MGIRVVLFGLIVVCCFAYHAVECKTKDTKQADALQSKETDTQKFMRLFVWKLAYEIAKSMGYGEQVSGLLGGALVPPGSEDDYDDYGDDFGDWF